MEDLCAYLAEYVRAVLGTGANVAGETFLPANVYSDANPSRGWEGAPTVEFSEGERDRKEFLDGSYRETYRLALAVRAETKRNARIAALVFDATVSEALQTAVAEGELDDYKLTATNVYPDERGVVSGETFVGFVEYEITEPRNFSRLEPY